MLDGIRILAVHHDSGLNGATLLFQSVLEGLAKDHGASISMRFPREGHIVARARKLGPVHVADEPPAGRPRRFVARVVGRLGRTLRNRTIPCDLIFANSAASLATVERIQVRDGTPLAVYVHESQYLLQQVCDFRAATRMLRRAGLIFAVSAAVGRMLEDLVQPSARIAIASGFVPARPGTGGSDELPPAVGAAASSGAMIIGGAGTMSWWKGSDLFIAVARRIRQLLPQQHLMFIWIGEEHYPARRQLEHDIQRAELEGVVIFPGMMRDPTSFFQSLSLFLLPSREDSWPLVMLEAAAAGVPMVCFQNSGGAEQFLATGGGTAVPYLDLEAMAQAAARYLSEPELRSRDSRIAREIGRSVNGEEQIRKIASELAAMLPPRP
jgi:glycosyltransferase involved in cell wall biosynthesis